MVYYLINSRRALIIEQIGDAEYLIADKGCDSETISDAVRQQEMIPVFSIKSNNKTKEEVVD